jgi:hypothetical protein
MSVKGNVQAPRHQVAEIPQKLLWLRRVLLVKVVVTLFVWGLPSLLAPPALLKVLGVEMPADPVSVRILGAVVTAVAVAYWYAYRDPVRNVAIVRFGIVDNGLCTLTFLVLAATAGLSSWFYWVSAVLLALFFVAFVGLLPRED